MKKLFFYSILLLTTITTCNSQVKNTPKVIPTKSVTPKANVSTELCIGKWKLFDMSFGEELPSEEKGSPEYSSKEMEEMSSLIIKADGSFEQIESLDEMSKKTKGTWKTAANKRKITFYDAESDKPDTYTIEELTANKMKISLVDGDSKITVTYTK